VRHLLGATTKEDKCRTPAGISPCFWIISSGAAGVHHFQFHFLGCKRLYESAGVLRVICFYMRSLSYSKISKAQQCKRRSCGAAYGDSATIGTNHPWRAGAPYSGPRALDRLGANILKVTLIQVAIRRVLAASSDRQAHSKF
jgi:hypothetical protein